MARAARSAGLTGVPPVKTLRQLTVWLHVLTSVGWMALAAVMAASIALAAGDPAQRLGALTTAHHLDQVLLAPMAVGSALTGIVLAAATPFGFFHHWWVTVKFAITLVQLYLGIFVISGALDRGLAAPETVSVGALLAAPVLMATGIAFQAWVSVAKPWGRTPWSGRGRPKPPTGPRWVFAVTIGAVVVDQTLALASGTPTPYASPLVLLVVLGHRAWVLRRSSIRAAAIARTIDRPTF